VIHRARSGEYAKRAARALECGQVGEACQHTNSQCHEEMSSAHVAGEVATAKPATKAYTQKSALEHRSAISTLASEWCELSNKQKDDEAGYTCSEPRTTHDRDCDLLVAALSRRRKSMKSAPFRWDHLSGGRFLRRSVSGFFEYLNDYRRWSP